MRKILFCNAFIVLMLCACVASRQSGNSSKKEAISLSAIDSYLLSLPKDYKPVFSAVDSLTNIYTNDSVNLKILVRHLFEVYLMSEMQSAENIAISLYDNYYQNGKLTEDKDFMDAAADFAKKFRVSLVGKKAKNLKMESITGTHEALYDIDAPYTFVYFFDPTCSHCKIVTPKIYKAFRKYADKGLAGYCVYTLRDKEQWVNYVVKNNLTAWTNVWDPNNENDFRIAYSIYFSPQAYLLDKDKNIIARRLDDVGLSEMMEKLLNK